MENRQAPPCNLTDSCSSTSDFITCWVLVVRLFDEDVAVEGRKCRKQKNNNIEETGVSDDSRSGSRSAHDDTGNLRVHVTLSLRGGQQRTPRCTVTLVQRPSWVERRYRYFYHAYSSVRREVSLFSFFLSLLILSSSVDIAIFISINSTGHHRSSSCLLLLHPRWLPHGFRSPRPPPSL